MRELSAPCPPSESLTRLSHAARRGRLPGFLQDGPDSFRVRVFGDPFDRRLVGRILPGPDGSRLTFSLRTLPLLPLVFIAIGITTVWPGIWLTASMLETYYPPSKDWIPIWWWYLPLTALPLPWVARSMWRKSQATAARETRETLSKIEAAVAQEPPSGGAIPGEGRPPASFTPASE